MRRILVTIILAVTILIAVQGAPTVNADAPRVKVIQIGYPRAVQPGSLFAISVEVSYSDKYGMIDVGIWDPKNGAVIQSQVSNVTLQGAGQGTFTFSLRAPTNPGEWKLEAIVRAWVQEAWFNDEAGFMPFRILILDAASLTLTNLQPNAKVVIDGNGFTQNSSVLSQKLRFGTHNIEVPGIIQLGLGSRLIFTGWSDGGTPNPRIVNLNGNQTYSPTYDRQYLLTVNSSTDSAGSGWYSAGKVAQFAVPEAYQSEVIPGLTTNQYQFASWSGDSNSVNAISTIVMDGPKTVTAKWTSSLVLNLNIIAYLFIGLSCVLASIILFRKTLPRERSVVRVITVIMMMLLAFGTIPGMIPVSGQMPTPANAAIVSIGDAYWYYWNNTASDTCIFWLGGGTVSSQGGYLINPLEYESFGTIRFLQDLERFYCVVALQKGSSRFADIINRTIYQEPIQGQFSIDRQVHRWINAQGYKHIFLLGYSVGAIASESIALNAPQDWTSADGLVLFTALLPDNLLYSAQSLNANLLLLYGHAPTFEATGIRFLENTPKEGWHGSSYFHKEFRVIDNVGHEVWSPLKNNTYSPTALMITVNFIEKSKALQMMLDPSSAGQLQANSTLSIVSAILPQRIYWDEPFVVNALISSRNPTTGIALVAFDSSTNRSLSVTEFSTSSGNASMRLTIPSVNMTQTSFSLMLVQKHGDSWRIVSKPYLVKMTAANQPTLRILTHVPNTRILIDGTSYTASNGAFQMQVSREIHTVELQGIIDNTDSRYTFTAWNDSVTTPSRTVQLDSDTSLEAVYQAQYRVGVASQFGSTSGNGWHDADSTFVPQISPVVSTNSSTFFHGWTNGREPYGLGAPIHVNSPTTIRAEWIKANKPENSSGSNELALFSVLMFVVLLVVSLQRRNLH